MIERLRGKKTKVNLKDLYNYWRKTDQESIELAQKLEGAGLFEAAGQWEWRVSRLYRPALDLPD